MSQLFTTYNLPISTILPTNMLQPNVFNPFVISPVNPLNSLIPNPLIPNPLISLNPLIPRYPNVVAFQDVNNDRNLKAQVIAYFYTKIVNNWLRYHYLDLYQMFQISNGKAILSKNISDTNTSKNDNENEIKLQYMIDNYLTKNDLLKLFYQNQYSYYKPEKE